MGFLVFVVSNKRRVGVVYDENAPLSGLRTELANRKNFEIEGLSFFYGGTQLDESQSLSSQGFKDKGTLRMKEGQIVGVKRSRDEGEGGGGGSGDEGSGRRRRRDLSDFDVDFDSDSSVLDDLSDLSDSDVGDVDGELVVLRNRLAAAEIENRLLESQKRNLARERDQAREEIEAKTSDTADQQRAIIASFRRQLDERDQQLAVKDELVADLQRGGKEIEDTLNAAKRDMAELTERFEIEQQRHEQQLNDVRAEAILSGSSEVEVQERMAAMREEFESVRAAASRRSEMRERELTLLREQIEAQETAQAAAVAKAVEDANAAAAAAAETASEAAEEAAAQAQLKIGKLERTNKTLTKARDRLAAELETASTEHITSLERSSREIANLDARVRGLISARHSAGSQASISQAERDLEFTQNQLASERAETERLRQELSSVNFRLGRAEQRFEFGERNPIPNPSGAGRQNERVTEQRALIESQEDQIEQLNASLKRHKERLEEQKQRSDNAEKEKKALEDSLAAEKAKLVAEKAKNEAREEEMAEALDRVQEAEGKLREAEALVESLSFGDGHDNGGDDDGGDGDGGGGGGGDGGGGGEGGDGDGGGGGKRLKTALQASLNAEEQRLLDREISQLARQAQQAVKEAQEARDVALSNARRVREQQELQDHDIAARLNAAELARKRRETPQQSSDVDMQSVPPKREAKSDLGQDVDLRGRPIRSKALSRAESKPSQHPGETKIEFAKRIAITRQIRQEDKSVQRVLTPGAPRPAPQESGNEPG